MPAVDEKVCDERHEHLTADIQEIKGDVKSLVTLLRGSNSNPGLVDKVRDQERFTKILTGMVIFVGTVAGTQFIQWLFRRLG